MLDSERDPQCDEGEAEKGQCLGQAQGVHGPGDRETPGRTRSLAPRALTRLRNVAVEIARGRGVRVVRVAAAQPGHFVDIRPPVRKRAALELAAGFKRW